MHWADIKIFLLKNISFVKIDIFCQKYHPPKSDQQPQIFFAKKYSSAPGSVGTGQSCLLAHPQQKSILCYVCMFCRLARVRHACFVGASAAEIYCKLCLHVSSVGTSQASGMLVGTSAAEIYCKLCLHISLVCTGQA